MTTLTLDSALCIQGVEVTDSTLMVELSDGRTLTTPLVWYPRLIHATPAERDHWELIGDGEGIQWPDLDEDLSLEGMICARPSGESQKSFQTWLSKRQ
jgi:hypothetical protein